MPRHYKGKPRYMRDGVVDTDPKEPVRPPSKPQPKVKVQLDRRTILTCRPDSIARWRVLYPQLVIIAD